MTQEELDSMMGSDGEMEESFEEYEDAIQDYKVDASKKWPPPPPTLEHKVVHQLDDVAKDTEETSNKIFDVLENFSNDSAQIESFSTDLLTEISSIKATFETLEQNFPNIQTFKAQKKRCENIVELAGQITNSANMLSEQSLLAMDVMQYQDIHRQKIERVINVMRSLAKYMNSLFEGKIDDEKRVSSATHIEGDSTEDVVDSDDIEALIAAFGTKK